MTLNNFDENIDHARRLQQILGVGGLTKLLNEIRDDIERAEELPDLRQAKVKAVALLETTKQAGFSADYRLQAAEVARKIERKLGGAIRKAQKEGLMRSETKKSSKLLSPFDFCSRNELFGSGNTRGLGIYGFVDNISDEQFNEALAEAKKSGDLCRGSVAKRCVERIETNGPRVQKTHAARRVMQDLVITLSGLSFVVKETNPKEVDAQNHVEDIIDIRKSIAAINRFVSKVNKENK